VCIYLERTNEPEYDVSIPAPLYFLCWTLGVLGCDSLVEMIFAVENTIRLAIVVQVELHVAVTAAEAELVEDAFCCLHPLSCIHRLGAALALLLLWRHKRHNAKLVVIELVGIL